MSSQDEVFEGGSRDANAGTGGSWADRNGANDVEVASPGQSDGRGVTQVATQGGDPHAARSIAAQNGVENMRFPGGPLQLNDSTSVKRASSLAGNRDSTTQGGRFSRLHTGREGQVGGGLQLNNFLRPSSTANLCTDESSTFAPGGQARLQGSSSLKAEVGASGSLKDRIEFDGGE